MEQAPQYDLGQVGKDWTVEMGDTWIYSIPPEKILIKSRSRFVCVRLIRPDDDESIERFPDYKPKKVLLKLPDETKYRHLAGKPVVFPINDVDPNSWQPPESKTLS
jgi:hypothetical protein